MPDMAAKCRLPQQRLNWDAGHDVVCEIYRLRVSFGCLGSDHRVDCIDCCWDLRSSFWAPVGLLTERRDSGPCGVANCASAYGDRWQDYLHVWWLLFAHLIGQLRCSDSLISRSNAVGEPRV